MTDLVELRKRMDAERERLLCCLMRNINGLSPEDRVQSDIDAKRAEKTYERLSREYERALEAEVGRA